MLQIQNVKVVLEKDWDTLIEETYKRPYKLQQQRGMMDSGTFVRIVVPYSCPDDYEGNNYSYDDLPRESYGVKFEKWESETEIPQIKSSSDWHRFVRRFYPDLYMVSNDLYKKGLIEAGNYMIVIEY